MFHAGKPERNVVYAWEGEVAELKAEIERLRAEFGSMRSRLVADRNEVQAGGEFDASVIQTYINDIDAALNQQQASPPQDSKG